MKSAFLLVAGVWACGDNGATSTDAAPPVDAAPTCQDTGRATGERYAIDDCNFCTCEADGSETCTTRACATPADACEYDGLPRAYGATFPSTDDCNECVCATSGLACTRRETCPPSDEGAILLESLTQPCGDAAFGFTAGVVLDELPATDFAAPFLYQRSRPANQYPESLPDTTAAFRIRAGDGYLVCRIPNPGQEAIDIEATFELQTADAAFDEGLHGYLRKDRTGFLDAWSVVGTLPPNRITGTYDPNCIDFLGLSFDARIERDGSATGGAYKVCETDFYLQVGGWSVTAAP